MRILVIGGSGDIGQQVTVHLLRGGHSVCATYHSSDILSLQQHVNLEWKKIDCRKLDDLRDSVDSLGEFDGLVHAAGLAHSNKISEQRGSAVDEMLSINLGSAIMVTAVLFPKMVASQFGRLVFLGSIVGKDGAIGLSAYSSTKSGLEGFVKSIHKEIIHERRNSSGLDLTVNLVRPGYVESRMTKDLSEKIKQNICARSTLGHFVASDQVAKFVCLLLDRDSSHLSGGLYDVNGGQLI